MMCIEDTFGELWSRFVGDDTGGTVNYSEHSHIQVYLLVFLKKKCLYKRALMKVRQTKDCGQCRQLIDKVHTLDDSDTPSFLLW